MFKLINTKGRLTKVAKAAFSNARISGGANEIIIFPNAYEDDKKFTRITNLMKSIDVEWYAFNEDVYVMRHWLIKAVSDRSEAALIEIKNLIN